MTTRKKRRAIEKRQIYNSNECFTRRARENKRTQIDFVIVNAFIQFILKLINKTSICFRIKLRFGRTSESTDDEMDKWPISSFAFSTIRFLFHLVVYLMSRGLSDTIGRVLTYLNFIRRRISARIEPMLPRSAVTIADTCDGCRPSKRCCHPNDSSCHPCAEKDTKWHPHALIALIEYLMGLSVGRGTRHGSRDRYFEYFVRSPNWAVVGRAPHSETRVSNLKHII